MKKSFISQIEIPFGEEVCLADIRDSIFQIILSEHPTISKNDYISISELNRYRRIYLSKLIKQEKGEIVSIDQDVMNAITNDSLITEELQEEKDDQVTFGQRLADKVAEFGGSWTFILSFFFFIIIWIVINSWLLINRSFDPYPFILLNLILSCLASIQAPIIMMSQNRQEQKDRIRAEHDYKINLKAELEIKLLNQKIDNLIVNQNNRLLEIQDIQTDYLEDLLKEINKLSNNKSYEK
jgi:uncharacterized membrane protein